MFSRNIFKNEPDNAIKNTNPAIPNYQLRDNGYGKHDVRVFQLKKEGPIHYVIEYIVNAHLQLSTHKEYSDGDNSDIIGSDVVETTIYVHSQKYGISTAEEFGLSLTQHFLDTYDFVTAANVIIEQIGWDRLDEHQKTPHNHVFLQNMNGRRISEIVRNRNEPKPLVIGGIVGLRLVKSACCPFNYRQSDLSTEGANPDRILNIGIDFKWEYKTIDGIDFTKHWHRVRDVVIKSFAGDPVKGRIIKSSQQFCYLVERDILDAFPEICSTSCSLQNFAQIPYDFSRFPPFEPKADVVIVTPMYKPHSAIYAETNRLSAE